MNDITFIMYRIGTGGKFVTEIADAGVNRYFLRNQKSAKGRVRWNEITKFEEFISDSQFSGHVHGFFPEEDLRKKYLDTIYDSIRKIGYFPDKNLFDKNLSYIIEKINGIEGRFLERNVCLKYLDSIKKSVDGYAKGLQVKDLFIDTHYTEPDTIDFFLENNHRVIYINSTVTDNELMAKNFFVKNFLMNDEIFPVDHESRMKVIRFIINDLDNIKYINEVNENSMAISAYINERQINEMNALLDDRIPLYKWPDEFFYVLFKFSQLTTGSKPTLSQREDSENLLNLNFSELCDKKILVSLNKFLKAPFNISVQQRFSFYATEQERIKSSSIEQLIESFRQEEKGLFEKVSQNV